MQDALRLPGRQKNVLLVDRSQFLELVTSGVFYVCVRSSGGWAALRARRARERRYVWAVAKR